jgi:hypothetical protein
MLTQERLCLDAYDEERDFDQLDSSSTFTVSCTYTMYPDAPGVFQPCGGPVFGDTVNYTCTWESCGGSCD